MIQWRFHLSKVSRCRIGREVKAIKEQVCGVVDDCNFTNSEFSTIGSDYIARWLVLRLHPQSAQQDGLQFPELFERIKEKVKGSGGVVVRFFQENVFPTRRGFVSAIFERDKIVELPEWRTFHFDPIRGARIDFIFTGGTNVQSTIEPVDKSIQGENTASADVHSWPLLNPLEVLVQAEHWDFPCWPDGGFTFRVYLE